MVLIKVDFPRPVCPANTIRIPRQSNQATAHTDTDHVELESTFEQFLLYLRSNAVESYMTSGKHCVSLRHGCSHGGCGGVEESILKRWRSAPKRDHAA